MTLDDIDNLEAGLASTRSSVTWLPSDDLRFLLALARRGLEAGDAASATQAGTCNTAKPLVNMEGSELMVVQGPWPEPRDAAPATSEPAP
jgi:hypothetical protein